jgi:hypothetical protein
MCALRSCWRCSCWGLHTFDVFHRYDTIVTLPFFNVQMLNIKAPTAIKSSVAAAEASPRRNLAKLLHPFK